VAVVVGLLGLLLGLVVLVRLLLVLVVLVVPGGVLAVVDLLLTAGVLGEAAAGAVLQACCRGEKLISQNERRIFSELRASTLS